MVNLHTRGNKNEHHIWDNELAPEVYEPMSEWYLNGDRFSEYQIQIRNYRETPQSCATRDTIEVDEGSTSLVDDDTTDAYWTEHEPVDTRPCSTTEGAGLHDKESVDVPSTTHEGSPDEGGEVDNSIDDIPLIEVEWT